MNVETTKKMTSEVARCMNPDCVAPFLRSTDREQFDSFCPACRTAIAIQAMQATREFDEAEDDGHNDA